MTASMTSNPTTTAVSAPGKVLLAGGYLVLDRAYTGLVFGLSARINVVAAEIHTMPGVHLTEIVVESPQFLDAVWRYGFHLAPEDGGITVTQLQVGSKINRNPFVETTLSYALTYIERVNQQRPNHSLTSTRLIILADNDYYSLPAGATATAGKDSRFARYPHTIGEAHKTGLGSSAALVTSLTAALLTHHLPPALFDLDTEAGKHTLHNLAQAAHCAAQGKVGSGFDVAAAVFGSCRYRRFSPSLLSDLAAPGTPSFADALVRKVDEVLAWDVEVDKTGVSLPKGVCLRMCDVDCGSQTVGMVKKVLEWRKSHPEVSKTLWDELQAKNEGLAKVLKDGEVESVGAAVGDVRKLIRAMGDGSGVPIEPESQTELLDALGAVDGVLGGVVPGAGGFDALALVMRDDDATRKRVEEFLDGWSKEKGGRVRLLGVMGEMEGARRESLDTYAGWLS
ncbi:Phosphomevalonate kinase [Colletotrichum higginsianum IMI 349063]|uniref:Phosphomevalonate kinase n=1 Tax=Colletotrichum higginsianum (strain IMI 349063) TaxID=759273 RepID=A0A1B7YKX5_COLHI|nr:Phosphomevalonate kinase [Colletotrichum higginsianum IMI 349063]OBR12612.1 Phosphomevalonate kinase [Colletotrichum higginsianum IMI 349063]